jgi:tetratricopeptide (TPR) repeat protein
MADDASEYLGLRLKGRYLIEEHIGSGLSAHAFRAYDTLLQGRVVVKIIKSTIAGIPIDLGEEWKKESHKAMQVRGHPHIASILDLGEETIEVDGSQETTHFIVTEFIEGSTLRTVENSNARLEPMALLTIAQQLLSTLDFLQARKLSHDDLHSGNIMVSQLGGERPFIKIIDFGMASNTLIPREKQKDVHFALGQLEALCQKTLGEKLDPGSRTIIESLYALLKKGQNFIPIGRMRLVDIIDEIDLLIQNFQAKSNQFAAQTSEDSGQQSRVQVDRRTRFIGRRSDVERLYDNTMGSFLSKRGELTMVCGEAGIGKTRIVDEVVRKLSTEQTRHLFLYRKCTSAVTSLPFASIFDAIIGFLDEIPGATDQQRLEVVLGNDVGLVRPLARLIDEHRISRSKGYSSGSETTDATSIPFLLVTFLVKAALTSPVLLFLDDLHLADDSTIDFLGFLLKRIKDSPIVIFSTHRPEDLNSTSSVGDHSLSKLLTEINDNNSARILELPGINREEFDEILANLYTFVNPAHFSVLSDAIRKMAGGNPFFLFEITSLMEDEGYIQKKTDNQWVFNGDIEDFAVPESIHSLMDRRVNRLSANEILLLRTAAIQGESWDLNIIREMFTPPGDDILDILNNLIKKHNVIQPREEGRYVFSHHQIHRAILGGMLPEDVERGHREVSRLLMKMAQDNNSHLPHHLIAYHLAKAGESKTAASHYLEAGKRALHAQQFQMAVDHLTNAEVLYPAPENTDQLAIDITINLLDSVKPLADKSVHENAVSVLQSLAEALDDAELKLRALLEKCVYLRTVSEHNRSLELAEELVKIAREEDNSEIEAAALKEAGTTSYLMGKMEAAEEYFHQAAGILASTVDRSQLARVYNNLGLVCRNTGRQEEMVRYFRRALDIFREVGDSIGERFPLGNLGIVYFERGEFERAYECFSALRQSLRDRADLMIEGKVDFSIGEIYLEVGLFDEARESCERALETFLTIGNRQGESEVLGTLGGIHIATGDLQLAREYFERSLEVKRHIGNIVGILHSQITLARISNMEGRHEDAVKQAESVLKVARERGHRSIELECLTEMMHARAHIDGAAQALTLLSSKENAEEIVPRPSAALVSFSYKVGEISFQAGDENRALKYIAIAGKIVEDILNRISDPVWREAYRKKRERIIDTYKRLKPALGNLERQASDLADLTDKLTQPEEIQSETDV